jgi:plastocyanin
MKRVATTSVVVVGSVVLLGACEGEPPVMSPSGVAGASAAPAPEPLPVAAPQPACPGSGAIKLEVEARGDASLDAAGDVEVTSSDVVAVVRGSIAGVVTTKPPGVAAHAVVYFDEAPAQPMNPTPSTVVVDAREMNFVPFIAVIPVGGKITFSNSDPFPHSVFSPDGEKFNVGNLPLNATVSRAFDHPGAYSLLCNMHPGMLGYVFVAPTPYFVRTDAKGKYRIEDVPMGSYRVGAWAPRHVPMTTEVTVHEGEVHADFDLHR